MAAGEVDRRRQPRMPLSLSLSLSSLAISLESNHHIHVTVENGIVKVTWTLPRGDVAGISYGGIDNLLESRNAENERGYWDIVWGTSTSESDTYWLFGSKFSIIKQVQDEVEISFSSRWDPTGWNSSDHPSLPMNMDKRYIVRRGIPGFYSYSILEREEGCPEANIYQIRAVFKLNGERFRYIAISDEIQTIMPTGQERSLGQTLDYKEAVLLSSSSGTSPMVKVDDKYQYSTDYKDNQVHGWVSHDPPVGFWMIIPSNEFRSAGPVKQDLTSHTGPTTLGSFHSAHYSGLDVMMEFKEGEPWKMVYGPVFIYLNSVSQKEESSSLWSDAKNQMAREVASWPYEFVSSEDYPKGDQRGSAKGRLLVQDRYNGNNTSLSGRSAWIGLAAPGEPGSWQTEAKGYQFWTKAGDDGSFTIKGVREGTYSLYAWVPGVLGDYKHADDIPITAGSTIQLGDLLFQPIRNGPIVWEIGIPDRTAAEYFIPSAATEFNNEALDHHGSRYRQYGLWKRYGDIYPDSDLVYTVGSSDYSKDWYFAHVSREVNKSFIGTTWQIKFNMDDVVPDLTYTLHIAIAAASEAHLQVRVNIPPESGKPLFSSSMTGKDNAIARHGIHGLHWFSSETQQQARDYDSSAAIAAEGRQPRRIRHRSASDPGDIDEKPSMPSEVSGQGSHTRPLHWPTTRVNSSVADRFKHGVGPPVTLTLSRKKAVLDNGILQVTFSVPEGFIISIKFGAVKNVLEARNRRSNRGYWDVVWKGEGAVRQNGTERLVGRRFKLVKRDENATEISFVSKWRTWKGSHKFSRLPMNVDRRYTMLRGCSGFYSYAIFKREEGWPATNITQIRALYKLQRSKFRYMAVSDEIQRIMPMPKDRKFGQLLKYPEAVLLTNATNPDHRGEEDDKYQYSCETKDCKLHGWISFDPPIGFWVITASNEFHSAGPSSKNSLLMLVQPPSSCFIAPIMLVR
ncbi:hypothetical protein Droror1_Dr00021990 [Drosera rotundifolia]